MAAVPRIVLHLDMDAFYAAVEVRENPELRGKPLIVGHPGRRGVVTTCSYEARKFGVHSAMPSVRAQRLCPDAIWVRGRMKLYSEISRRIREIMRASAPVVEPISIDEAFIDVTGLAASLDEGAAFGRELKRKIVEAERLTASVGVAPNKFLAKLASDLDKPDGLVVIGHDDLPTKVWPLPVKRLWGVGPKTGDRLNATGLHTIGDVHEATPQRLSQAVGPTMADHLARLARGEDKRRIVSSRAARSISEERTYGEDLTDPQRIDREMLARAEGVARSLRRHRLVARTVQIKVRKADFTTWTRAHTLHSPTDVAETIVAVARDLFRDKIELKGAGVRLLGVGVSHLEEVGAGQGRLFGGPGEERARRVARAADAVRDKLGDKALTRARLLKRKDGD